MSDPFTEDNESTHVIDIDGIQEAKFENLANGWYDAEVIEHEYGLSQNSGGPMWTLKVEISVPDGTTRKMNYYMAWSPKAAPYTKAATAKCFGDVLSNPNYRDANNKFDIRKVGDEAAFVGRRIQVKIGKNKYEGDVRDQIKDIRPGGDRNEFLAA